MIHHEVQNFSIDGGCAWQPCDLRSYNDYEQSARVYITTHKGRLRVLVAITIFVLPFHSLAGPLARFLLLVTASHLLLPLSASHSTLA